MKYTIKAAEGSDVAEIIFDTNIDMENGTALRIAQELGLTHIACHANSYTTFIHVTTRQHIDTLHGIAVSIGKLLKQALTNLPEIDVTGVVE